MVKHHFKSRLRLGRARVGFSGPNSEKPCESGDDNDDYDDNEDALYDDAKDAHDDGVIKLPF